ncbi:ketoacyl-ACP synthase III [Dehalobacterium formicoaceticum]|uniref:ketoacyl-ACP synthase III n=1 Tax=Dehalobacterium formicoaceticum TaxID=51515 RepID=UPI000B7D3E05|nr:ketoacyl-ACP synthase III [Dehalobacterium formicoaceticum]
MAIGIKAIEYVLPEKVLTNKELEQIYGDWTAEKILTKTGIASRHVVSEGECASDLAEQAAQKLFNSGVISPEEIDFILLATQSPDYQLPTTACILQDRLGIPQSAGALDFNLGCSAYIYGLAMAKSFINTGIAKNVLLLTSETYTKHIHPLDKSTRTIFGDAAAATLVSEDGHEIGNFDLGTDGSGKDALIIPSGGSRIPRSKATAVEIEDNGSIRSQDNLFMDGTEVFSFTIRVVPESVNNILRKHNLSMEDINLFVFHQANEFMLDFLRKKLRIPKEKFYINMQDTGNTVSSTIPIAFKRAQIEGRIQKGDRVLLCGFGVGLSWGSTIITY